jgi:phage-related protein (TIGR01555 family)
MAVRQFFTNVRQRISDAVAPRSGLDTTMATFPYGPRKGLPLDVNKKSQFQNAYEINRGGAMGLGDRTADSFLPLYTSNPYTSNDYLYRWRQYVMLYETSWEARKIIRIVPEDALRKPWVAEDIPEEAAEKIQHTLDDLQFLSTLKRSLMLERLLGGCLSFMGIESEEDDPGKVYTPKTGSALRFVNSIPLSRIARVTWNNDPLSVHYMRPERYLINGSDVHVSRCLIWDGEPLFDPYDFALTPFRANLAGFGPSKLAPIWDDIIKAVGTRQAAYQLIQTNNAIIAAISDLADLGGTVPGKQTLEKIKQMANTMSVYRAAIIDGEKVQLSQHSASFGSVPELLITYLIVLSAASDIPATRFLGQAPGGLNATGESDLENYYNVIDAYQQQRIGPQLRRVYDVIGYHLFPGEWEEWRRSLQFKFPPMWNASELEEAQRSQITIDNVLKLVEQRLMTDKKALQELNAKSALSVKLDQTDLDLLTETRDQEKQQQLEAPDPDEEIQKMRNVGRVWNINFSNSEGYHDLIQAAGGDPKLFDLVQFEKGLKVEQEHFGTTGGDEIEMAKIVLDHLRERSDYYDRLERVENVTEAQLRAGNYPKKHLKVGPMDVSVETPLGSTRQGKDPDGREWSVLMPCDYGYVRRTEGADGDHVDLFLGPDVDSTVVYLIDQVDPDSKKFDEHKAMAWFDSEAKARDFYVRSFSDGRGPDRIGALSPMSMADFRAWLKDGDQTKPYRSYGILVGNIGDFDESKHPRAEDGKFGKSGNPRTEDGKSQEEAGIVSIKTEVPLSFMKFAKATKSKIFTTKHPPGSMLEIKAGAKENAYEDLMPAVDKMYESAKGTEKEHPAGYIKRSVELGAEDKKYNISLQLNENGDIVGAASMHLLSDSVRIETLGGLGKGAGKSCLISAIRQSIKAGKGGAITLTPLPSVETKLWYLRRGFVEKQNSRYNEYWLSPEAAKKLLEAL